MKLLLLALCLGLCGACGGEGNVCQQACERQKSCGEAQLAKLDCNDPQIASICDMARKALAVDCSQASQGCSGELEAESRRTATCDLDPQTCTCPRNVCLEVCRDQKDCAESSLETIDCAASNNQQTCAELRQMFQKDCYAIFDASCTGALKTEAEQLDGCFLDHTTCTCLTR